MKFNFKKKKEEPAQGTTEEQPIAAETQEEQVTESKKIERRNNTLMEQYKKYKRKVVTYFWGSEERPLHPFSWRAKFKRWFYCHYRGWVYYITTMYDKPNDEYLYDCDFVPKSKIPREAVHVTNEKFTWHLDLDHPHRGFDPTPDFGFTAHDAFLYIKCNKIDEAMKINLDDRRKTDWKMIGIIIACAVAFVIFYMMYSQR